MNNMSREPETLKPGIRRGHLVLVHSRRGARQAQHRRTRLSRRPARSSQPSLDPAAYSQTLGDIIIAAGGKVPKRVVLAAAIGTLDAGRFAADLAAHSRHLGLAVLAAGFDNSGGRPALHWYDAPGVEGAESEPLALDLFNPRWPEDFDSWRRRTARFADMVLVAGPPLAHSAESALIACAFDGCVILAHRSVTPTEVIDEALHRCRETGARIYGVVFVDGEAPSWRRVMTPGAWLAPSGS